MAGAAAPTRPAGWLALHALPTLAALLALLSLLFAVAAPSPARAHDIPAEVRLQLFLKPEPGQLRLLLRAPMAALREIDVPLRPGGFIDLAQREAVEQALRQAASQWLLANMRLYEDGRELSPRIQRLRLTLPSDRSFASFAQAQALLAAPPLPAEESVSWNQLWLDAELSLPIAAPDAQFAIEPRFARLGLSLTLGLRLLAADGREHVFELHGDPGLVALTPSWHQAAWRFVQQGFWHILEGSDHLLFLACLVIPLRRLRPLVVTATAFTLAHSLTLAATALGLGPQGGWFPPAVECLIAASILWVALANVLSHGLAAGGGSPAASRWGWAFGFGLLHGFGFAFALRESLQFAGDHLLSALLAFNLGVEAGQIAALLLALPLLGLLLRWLPERPTLLLLSALAAHQAWHWLAERVPLARQYPWPRWEALGAREAAEALGWLLAAMLLLALLRALRGRVARWAGESPAD